MAESGKLRSGARGLYESLAHSLPLSRAPKRLKSEDLEELQDLQCDFFEDGEMDGSNTSSYAEASAVAKAMADRTEDRYFTCITSCAQLRDVNGKSEVQRAREKYQKMSRVPSI